MRATEIRCGNVIKHDGIVGVVIECHHRTPGNKGGFMQIKYKSIDNGNTYSAKILTLKNVERVILDKVSCQYLYQDGDMRVFMNNETYEQFPLADELLTSALPYMILNSEVTVLMLNEKPVSIELPPAVILKVTETEDVVRGNTANALTKDAILETGLSIKVPAHIKIDDLVKVNTQTGEFLERSK